MNGIVWPDILIAAIFAIAVLKGYKRGFVMELSGAVALAVGLIVPWFYNGAFDEPLGKALHLAIGAAHVLAIFLVGIAAYAAVMIVARVLNAIAKLPVIGLGNALGGGAVSLLKALVCVWLILYIALFFPLSPQIRSDLHGSKLAAFITQANPSVDDALIATLPAFARGLVTPLFSRHRV